MRSENGKTYIIAEIGTSHGGSLKKAYALIDAAAESGADCVKFQWVYAKEILHPDTGYVALPGGKIRLYDRFLELEEPFSFYKKCAAYARKKKLDFGCSPFGIKSLHQLWKLNPDMIKIASPELNHFPMLKELIKLEDRKKAGLFGVYTILGLEEKDVITAGGGAVLMAPGRREWIVLKKYTDEAPLTDLLPDINCALAWVQLKEFARNEKTRHEIFNMYLHSCMIGRHKTFARDTEGGSTMCSFPLILTSSFKDVKSYTAKKDIEIQQAFAGSVIALKDELSESCIHAKSLLLRTAHFPLYPRLTQSQVAKIAKVLGTLP